MTPEERKKFIDSFKQSPAPAAPVSAPTVSPSELEKKQSRREFIESFRTKPKAPVPAGPVPTAEERRQTAAGPLAVTTGIMESETEEDKLRKELTYKIRNENLLWTDDAVRSEVERQIGEMKSPVAVGGYDITKPFTSKLPFVPAPSSAPVNVKPIETPGILDVLRPQVKVPETEVHMYQSPFDDVAFERSLKDLPVDEQKQQRAQWKAYKRGYDKIRELNPNISHQEIISDLQRQISELPDAIEGKGRLITQDPRVEMGISNDPTAIALSRQTKEGKVPNLEPGQLAFLQGIYEAELPDQKAADRARLSQKGAKPITRIEKRPTSDTVGGKPLMEDVEVKIGSTDYTPAEIEDIISKKEKGGQYDARPWWMSESEKENVLRNPEKYTTGGALFAKKYPTGATVESPTAWFLRSAMAVPNALAGTVGYAFTPEDIQKQKEAGREEKFRAPGLYSNVLANVAEGGGYTQEIGDLYKYNPDPEVRKYETLGRLAGFTGDLLGLGDLSLIEGGIGGAKASVEFTRAARAAGEGLLEAGATGLKAGTRGAVGAYVESLPGMSRLAEKLVPGDVRLIYGAKLADEFSAARKYEKAFDEALAAGATDAAAHDAGKSASTSAFPESKFADDVEKTFNMREVLRGDYFTEGQKAFRQYSDIAETVDKLERGVEISTAEERLIKPYLSAAAGADTKIAKAIRQAYSGVATGERVRAAQIFEKLATDGKQAYADAIKATAAFDNGVKVIDTGLANVYSRGAKTVAVTPRTFATPAGAVKLAKDFRNTKFYTNVLEPIQRGMRADVVSGKAVVQGYDLTRLPTSQSSEISNRILNAVNEAEIAGLIPRSEAARITSEVSKGSVSAADLQTLTHAVVDNLAGSTRTGFTSRALAEVSRPAERTIPQQILRQSAAQSRRASELKSGGLLILKRPAARLYESLRPLEAAVTAEQRALITSARSKVSALDKVFRDEFTRISTDPEFAKLYGVTTDASDEEKLIALGHGPLLGDFESASSTLNRKQYADELVKSLIYGTEKTPLYNAISPAYKWGETLLASSTEYNALIRDVSMMSPAELSARLDEVFDSAADIVKNNINPLIDAAGGSVLSVPKSLSAETLAVAYARVKSADIMAETAVKLAAERPVALSDTPKFLSKISQTVTGSDNLWYEIIKSEIKTPGSVKTAIDDDVTRLAFIEGVVSKTLPGATNKPFISKYISDIIKADSETFLSDVLFSANILEDSRVINGTKMEQSLAQIDLLISNKIPAETFVSPALAQKLASELGSAPKFKGMLTELARMSDLAGKGDKKALQVSGFFRQLWDSYNAFYYHAILSVNPRFHGVNNLTAPLITYYTTGKIVNPVKWAESANIMLLGGPKSADAASRMVPVVTDRFGNIYTRGQLYDLAIKSGIFKSAISTEVARDFIADANDVMGRVSAIENKYLAKGNKVRKQVFTPWREFLGDPLAAWTDNVWRMNSIRDALETGSTIDEALDFGRRSLFDYGTLTDAERVVSRNFFVFYNYYRQSIVQFMKNFAENPGRMIKLFRLTKDLSDIAIGDQNARDLSFYYPPEFGVARGIVKLDTAAKSKEGEAIMLPMMPYADGLNIFAGMLSDPVGTIIGPEMVGEKGRRAWEKGLIASKVGTGTKYAGQAFFSDVKLDQLLEVKLTKNRLPPEHVAFFESLGVGTQFLTTFNAEVKTAEPGENSYRGKVYVISDAETEHYREWLIKFQATGVSRPIGELGKIIGTLGNDQLKGAYADTTLKQWLSAIGAIAVTGSGIPELQLRKGISKQGEDIKNLASELEKKRLPAKEKPL